MPDMVASSGPDADSVTAVAAADWSALGCAVRLVVTRPSRLADARALLTQDLADLDLACSRFRDDSEIHRLDTADGATVTISPLLTAAIGVALDTAADSDGDVDPTVGSALVAWGYDRTFSLVPPNGPAVTVRADPVPGWRLVELDRDARTVRLPAGVRLDLGATAKAWAADRAAARIADQIGGGVLVGLGGDIAVAGDAPAGGWQIRVEDSTGDVRQPAPAASAHVTLTAGGLATSSTTVRRWQRGGRTVHHILDPLTGSPATGRWRTASVAAESALAANAASTRAIIRAAGATARLEAAGLPARLVAVDGSRRVVAGWPADAETVAA